MYVLAFLSLYFGFILLSDPHILVIMGALPQARARQGRGNVFGSPNCGPYAQTINPEFLAPALYLLRLAGRF